MGNQITEIKAPFSQEDIAKGENFYRTRALAELSLPPKVQANGKVINEWAQKAKDYSGVDHYRDYLGTQELRSRMFEVIKDYDLLMLPTFPYHHIGRRIPV